VNHHDIVTHIPHIPPFEHAGNLNKSKNTRLRAYILLAYGSAFEACLANPPWDATVQELFNHLGQLKSNIEERRLLRSFADHAPIFYSKILWNRFVAETNN